jgi:hypothetical protein
MLGESKFIKYLERNLNNKEFRMTCMKLISIIMFRTIISRYAK